MSADSTSTSIVGSVVTVGASGVPVGISVIPGGNSVILQYLSGNTLWIGGATLTFGNGFLWDVSQIKAISFEDYSGSIFLSAGVTSQISVIIARRAGFE